MIHQYQLPLESERLYYRPITKADTTAWEAFFENNPQLHFVGIKNPKTPAEEAIIWIERQIKRYEETGIGMLAAIEKPTGDLIGNVGIIWREDILGEDLFEIGYAVIPSRWNMGYASEMAIRMKAYFKEQALAKKVISLIHVDNLGSQKVAEKNGMRQGEKFEYSGSMSYCYYDTIKP